MILYHVSYRCRVFRPVGSQARQRLLHVLLAEGVQDGSDRKDTASAVHGCVWLETCPDSENPEGSGQGAGFDSCGERRKPKRTERRQLSMAVENRVFLNGRIEEMRISKNDKNQTFQVTIGLYVMRRPQAAMGNQSEVSKTDIVLVYIRDLDQIKYLSDHNATMGDFLGVYGVLSTIRGLKHFTCKCGHRNNYETVVSYVHPMYLWVYEVFEKQFETIPLSRIERMGKKDEIVEVLNKRKMVSGDIIAMKDLGLGNDGNYYIRITARKEPEKEDVNKYLKAMGEVSNHVFAMGHLCADPVYNPKDNGGRVCTYQLAINRKVYIDQDGPAVRTDYPWVKSLGNLADQDRDALKKGSLVFIDGSLQARRDFNVKRICEACGEVCEVKGRAMEIVPYSVEYLEGCNKPNQDENEEEFEDEVEEAFDGYTEGQD